MPHSVSQKKPEIPAWSRVGTNVDLNNSHAFNAPWALELYQHGELDRWVDGPSIFERVIRWAISLNGSSSRVVWPIRSWPIPKNIRNTSKHGAFTEQGFSFDYLASRNKVEHGCTEDCDGQMITLWSRGYAPNLSTWCISPDRVIVLFRSKHTNMPNDDIEQGTQSEAAFSIYIHEASTHSTPAFELPAYHNMGYGSKGGFETFSWSHCGRLMQDIAQKLRQQWFKLLDIASSHMRELVRWTT